MRRCGRSTEPCKPVRLRSLARARFLAGRGGRPVGDVPNPCTARTGEEGTPDLVTSPWGFKSVGSAVRFARDAHQALRGKPWGFKSVSNLSTCSEQGEHRVDVSEDRHHTGLHAPNPRLPRSSAGSSPHERTRGTKSGTSSRDDGGKSTVGAGGRITTGIGSGTVMKPRCLRRVRRIEPKRLGYRDSRGRP